METVEVIVHYECGHCGRVRDKDVTLPKETWDAFSCDCHEEVYTDSQGVNHRHLFDVCQACK